MTRQKEFNELYYKFYDELYEKYDVLVKTDPNANEWVKSLAMNYAITKLQNCKDGDKDSDLIRGLLEKRKGDPFSSDRELIALGLTLCWFN